MVCKRKPISERRKDTIRKMGYDGWGYVQDSLEYMMTVRLQGLCCYVVEIPGKGYYGVNADTGRLIGKPHLYNPIDQARDQFSQGAQYIIPLK